MERKSSGIADKLLGGDRKIGVWGTGFIGYSTMAYFANTGIECIGYDIDPERVERIEDGQVPVSHDMESWLGFDVAPLVSAGLIEASDNYEDVLVSDVPVHFLAIPTEKEGLPWEGALSDTVELIANIDEPPTEEPLLIVIESTLTPGMTDDVVMPILEGSDLVVGEEVLVGVAPRRDWFIAADKKLDTLPRIIGGQDEMATAYMEAVLDLICENLVPAPDYQHAELVKSVENAYRHVGITLANQLARAYPDLDMRTVLEMVGTKWNVPTYFPSVGIGGYCVPVASQYVLAGTDHGEELSILHETVETDRGQPLIVADALAERGVESVALLGLSYKGDLDVDVLSPTIPIANRLREHDIDVGVHDPYFDDEHIARRTGASSIAFPDGLDGVDGVLLLADHRQYEYIPNARILEAIEPGTVVVDNHKVWNDIPFEENGVEYFYTGGKNWLRPVVADRVTTSQRELVD